NHGRIVGMARDVWSDGSPAVLALYDDGALIAWARGVDADGPPRRQDLLSPGVPYGWIFRQERVDRWRDAGASIWLVGDDRAMVRLARTPDGRPVTATPESFASLRNFPASIATIRNQAGTIEAFIYGSERGAAVWWPEAVPEERAAGRELALSGAQHAR